MRSLFLATSFSCFLSFPTTLPTDSVDNFCPAICTARRKRRLGTSGFCPDSSVCARKRNIARSPFKHGHSVPFYRYFHEHSMLDSTQHLHTKPVYTPLALRDWFRAAPRHPLKALTRLRLAQPRAVRERISRSTRRFCLPVMLTFGSFSRVYLFSSNEAFTADVNRWVLHVWFFTRRTYEPLPR